MPPLIYKSLTSGVEFDDVVSGARPGENWWDGPRLPATICRGFPESLSPAAGSLSLQRPGVPIIRPPAADLAAGRADRPAGSQQ